MGALTSNRKGAGDYFKSISSPAPFDKSCGHISKKPKLSACMSPTTPPSVGNSVAARIAKYPERKLGFPRTVHAPVSHRLAAGSRDSPADKMGRFGFFYRNYEKIKESALRSLRYVGSGKQKEEEVIRIDSSDELDCDPASKDSSIGKVEIVDSQRRRWKGGEGAVEKEVRSLDSYVITDAVAKVDDTEKNGLSLMDSAAGDSEQPFYKKLHNQANKRDSGLINISLRIDSHEKQIQGLRLLRTAKKEEPIEKYVAEECFVPLTREERAMVSRALSNSHRKKVLVSHANSGIDISGEILQCLGPRAWLNDEVINVYFELLKEREKREPEKFLKCHFFNTFFYKKLMSSRGGYNFQSVRRWTTQKKLGYSLLECDKIFVPIHQEIHWCLAVINKKDKKFQYLDPLGDRDSQVLNALCFAMA
ncbi:ubiquitin-like-specific protease ESD4 [Salvia hispanica]|uniref:ubiquitin-like-specific protease ESD4 n=1 Tax=Salvia hispanica TaxID=49212 RepID=UPI002009236A|nr:ubiquitin-like-specific protease ESD4 [Salvia hispanica]